LLFYLIIIGLGVLAGVLINILINQKNLVYSVIGSVILLLTGAFACFVIYYPFYFASFQNLIWTLALMAVILIVVYIGLRLIVNMVMSRNNSPAFAETLASKTEPVQYKTVRVQKSKPTRARKKMIGSVEVTRIDKASLQAKGKKSAEAEKTEHPLPAKPRVDIAPSLAAGAKAPASQEPFSEILGTMVVPDELIMQSTSGEPIQPGTVEETTVTSAQASIIEEAPEPTQPETVKLSVEPVAPIEGAEPVLIADVKEALELTQPETVKLSVEPAAPIEEAAEPMLTADVEQALEPTLPETVELSVEPAAPIEEAEPVLTAEEAPEPTQPETVELSDEPAAPIEEAAEPVLTADVEEAPEPTQPETFELSVEPVVPIEEAPAPTQPETFELSVEPVAPIEEAAESMLTADVEEAPELTQPETVELSVEPAAPIEEAAEPVPTADVEEALEPTQPETVKLSVEPAAPIEEAAEPVPDRFSALFAKAEELVKEGKYNYAVRMAEACLNYAAPPQRKHADIMYLECLVLSNQFEQAQKKWLEVLNKMYILEPADKIKLKEILEKLNSYKRQVS
jgi:hypothetical protein